MRRTKLHEPKMNPMAGYVLSSRQPVSDEVAAFALGEFFQAVLDTDGPCELRRLYAAFYMQAHGELPLIDWSDKELDGSLKAKPGTKAATNGN